MWPFTYAVDVVLVVDNGKELAPHIDAVKLSAVRLPEAIKTYMKDFDEPVSRLRVRLILTNDKRATGPAFAATPFHELPHEQGDFARAISESNWASAESDTGSLFQALTEAMRSPWDRTATGGRQVIVVWSNALSPQDRSSTENWDSTDSQRTAHALDDLATMWEVGDMVQHRTRCLVLIAPDAYPWSEMSAHWSDVVHFVSRAGHGLPPSERGYILDTIARGV